MLREILEQKLERWVLVRLITELRARRQLPPWWKEKLQTSLRHRRRLVLIRRPMLVQVDGRQALAIQLSILEVLMAWMKYQDPVWLPSEQLVHLHQVKERKTGESLMNASRPFFRDDCLILLVSDSIGVPKVPDVTREDLDSAIEAGNWAAVGATAALLAAASDSQSYSSRSRASTRGGSSISSLDAARAAELDHLVDAGDWEGVVVAASKFESSEENSTSAASQNSRTVGSSGFSAASTTLSDSPSKAAKRDEIREEVENLVRRVVPEEIDNVDEMMLQFKGREEELVETLRTMQERQVAQKARVQGQKRAKRDARRAAHEGGLALPGPPSATPAPGGVSAAAAAGIGVGVAAAAGVAAAVGIASRRQDDSDPCVVSVRVKFRHIRKCLCFTCRDAIHSWRLRRTK